MLSYDLRITNQKSITHQKRLMYQKVLTNMRHSLPVFMAGLLFAGLTAKSARADLFKLTGSATPTCFGSGCPGTPPSLTVGQTQAPDAFSFNFTANGDPYTASGTETATYTAAGGTFFSVNINVVYTGLTSTAVVDTFGIDVFQNFFSSATGSWDGTYTESTGGLTISPGAGAGSSVSFDTTYNGGSNTDALPTLGPFTSSQSSVSTSAALTGLGTGNTLAGEFILGYSFAAGTQRNASVSLASPAAVTPEPRETLPLMILSLSGAAWIWKRKRSAMVSSTRRDGYEL
jgi:hypothetical protein